MKVQLHLTCYLCFDIIICKVVQVYANTVQREMVLLLADLWNITVHGQKFADRSSRLGIKKNIYFVTHHKNHD